LFFVSAAWLSFQAPATGGSDTPAAAKADDLAYSKTLEKRASEILEELQIKDPAIAGRVREVIIRQYRGLRDLHEARDAKIKGIQGAPDIAKDRKAGRIEAERASTEAAASSLNGRFLAALAKDLSPGQVETVQDRMTYHKLQVTYNGYLEMLPRLTAEQKRVVFEMLKEARDKAAYAGSAEEKTAIFGKYKGRVNNYLSAQGYDLKLASKEWAERRKGEK
jgi:hypothetical protein